MFERGTAGAIGHSQIDENYYGGINVRDGASPRIEENEVSGNAVAGRAFSIHGAGTDPLVRANRIHDSHTSGIYVYAGASPRIEENEIWANASAGIDTRGAGTDPLVRANRIHDGNDCGIGVGGGASPRIEENEVWANASAGISISGVGTDPLVRANRVHDGQEGIYVWQGAGIFVSGGASPQIEENEIWANASAGIAIKDADTSPVIIRNAVQDGPGRRDLRARWRLTHNRGQHHRRQCSRGHPRRCELRAEDRPERHQQLTQPSRRNGRSRAPIEPAIVPGRKSLLGAPSTQRCPAITRRLRRVRECRCSKSARH